MGKSKLRGLIIIVAVSVIILAVLIIRVRKTSEDKIVLSRYVLVTFDGFDGMASAKAVLDDVGLYSGLAGSGAKEEDEALYKDFVDSVTYSLDRISNISNGDELIVSVGCDEELAAKLRLKIDRTSRTVKASGLKEGTKLDVFAGVKIITGGISPYIYVTYSNEAAESYPASLKYDISKTSGLSIGDEITINCVIDRQAALKQGYYYDTDTMTYTIEKADKYIDDPSELDMKILSEIVEEDVAVIISEVADTTNHMSYEVTGDVNYLFRDGNEEARDFTLEKAVLARNVSGYEQGHENYVLLFYNGNVVMPLYNDSEDPYEYLDSWMCFIYSDAVLSADGMMRMATNDPKLRYVCGKSYDDVLFAVQDEIGRAYELTDFTIK